MLSRRRLSCFIAALFFAMTGLAAAQQFVWTGLGEDNNWSTRGNWAGGVAPPSSHVSTWIQLKGTARMQVVADSLAPWVLNRLDLEYPGTASFGPTSYTLSGTKLSFQGPSPRIQRYGYNRHAIHNNIEIPAGTLEIAGDGYNPVSFSGEISGSGGLLLSCLATLSGASTYTGPTNILMDTTITHGSALGAPGGTVTAGNAALTLDGGITVPGKTLTGAVRAIGGNNTWAGDMNEVTISSVNAGETFTVTGRITGPRNGFNILGAGDVLLTGEITSLPPYTGAFSKVGLWKWGRGTTILTRDNSFTTLVSIEDGVLVTRTPHALGVNSGVQLAANTSTHPAVVPTHGVLRLESDLAIGTLSTTSSYEVEGMIDLADYTLAVNQGEARFGFYGTITGSGKLVKRGAGTLALHMPNTHSGGTSVEAGTLKILSDSNLGTPPETPAVNLTLGEAGTLQSDPHNTTVLHRNRTILLTGSNPAGNFNTEGKPAGIPLTVSGKITGSGAAVKTGTGVLLLSNPANDYAGGTIIKAGAIEFGAAEAIGGTGPNVRVDPGAMVVAAYPIEQSTVDRIDPTSAGILALKMDADPILDLSGFKTLGIGAIGGVDFGGRLLSPPSGLNIGGAGGTMRFTAKDALSGSPALLVQPRGVVILAHDNTIEGPVTVRALLQVAGAHLTSEKITIQGNGKLNLAGATINGDVLVEGGQITGCGAINGNIVNHGTITISGDCTALTVTGTITNHGTIRVLGGRTLVASAAFTNNGLIDLVTSAGTVLPVDFVNNGTLIAPSPTATQVLSLSYVPGMFSLSMQSFAGHTYQLQRSKTLDPATSVWENAGPSIAPWGEIVTLRDYPNAGLISGFFYRVIVE